MKCLAYLPTQDGQATKAGLEAVSYAKKCGADVVALAVGSLNADGGAGSAGASKVLNVSQDLQDEAQTPPGGQPLARTAFPKML